MNPSRNKFSWVSSYWRYRQKQKLLRAYHNEQALRHYLASAHKDKFRPACPACKQLRCLPEYDDDGGKWPICWFSGLRLPARFEST